MTAEINKALTIILGCAGLSLCLFLAFGINIVVTAFVQRVKERRALYKKRRAAEIVAASLGVTDAEVWAMFSQLETRTLSGMMELLATHSSAAPKGPPGIRYLIADEVDKPRCKTCGCPVGIDMDNDCGFHD